MKHGALERARALCAFVLAFAGCGFAQIPASQAVHGCGPSPVGATCGGSGPASLGNTSGTDQGAGNPINLITGNKYQREVDLAPLPGELGLELVRHYNSLDRTQGSVGAGWRLSYDTELVVMRNTIQISEADGGRITFNRDPKHPDHCASEDPANGTLAIESQGAGARQYIWHWRDGRRLTFDSDGRLVEIRGPHGGILSLTHGLRGELLAVEDPLGRRLQFQYGTHGYSGIVAVDTPLGRIAYAHEIARESPRFGNLLRVQLPDGQALRRYHYEARFQAGNPHALTGISVERRAANGASTDVQRLSTYAYEPGGRARWSMHQGLDWVAVARSAPSGSLAHPAVAVMVNARGEQTWYQFADLAGSLRVLQSEGAGCASCGPTNLRYTYDTLGRLNSVDGVRPASDGISRVRYERDALGRVTHIRKPSVVPGHLHEIRFVFDADHPERLVRIEETGYSTSGPIRRHIDYRYDAMGRVLTRGGTNFRYDQRGRLAERRERGTVMRYHYDELSRPVRIELADGRVARYEYDRLGRVSLIDIAGARERYAYDAAGWLAVLTRANGERLHFRHDAAGRVISITDGAGRRIDLERDARGEVLARRLIAADGSVLQQRDEFRDAEGPDPEVRRDPALRAVGLREVAGTGPDAGGGYEYDDFGRLTRMRSGERGDTRFVYDEEDRLIERIQAGERIMYRHSADGRVIEKASSQENVRVELGANRRPERIFYREGTERLSYDAAARLTGHEWVFDGRVFATRFRYSADGRMTERTLPGGQKLIFTYRALPDPNAGLLRSIRLTGPGIDARVVDDLNSAEDSPIHRRFRLLGNVPYRRDLDVEGHLSHIGSKGLWKWDAPASAKPRFTWANLPAADADHPKGPAASARTFEWDAERRLTGVRERGRLIASYGYDAAGQRVRKTVYTADGELTTRFLYEDDRLIAEIDSRGTVRVQYIWLDEQPVALIRDGKVYGIVADHQYAPRAVFNAAGNVPVEAITNLRASHQYHDGETGLSYNGRRYLDPATGRYLSADPLGLAGGLDPFAFHGSGGMQGIDVHGTQARGALADDPAVGNWSLEQKLAFIFSEAADQIQDHELADALRELVSPGALATTAAIFTVWTASQFTPYGWVGDLALTGVGALLLGNAVWDVIQATYAVAAGIATARCESDLRNASGILASRMAEAAASVTASALPLGGARIARLLRTVFRRDLPAVRRSSVRAAADQARFGVFNPARGNYSGAAANREWIQRQRASGRSDAHPPWDPARNVADTWLNPGDRIYVIQERYGTPGGWATTKQYNSLSEARNELAVLNEFKRSGSDLVLREYTINTAIPVRVGYAGPQVSGWPASETYVGGGQQIQFLVDMRVPNWEAYLTPTKTYELIQ